MTDDLCEVVITAPDPDWLVEFTRQLVADRLAASGHNITPIRSIYRWQGEIYDRPEARVALHTRRDLVARIVEREWALRANARMAAIVESSHDAIISRTLEGTILTCPCATQS